MQSKEKSIWTETFVVATDDLSAKAYHGVYLSGNRTVRLMSDVTFRPVGVLLNEPKAGQEALVCVVGRCPVKLSATLAAGEPIYFHTDGTIKKWVALTDTTKYCAGYITIGGVSGEMGEAMIQCVNPPKGDLRT